MTFTEYLKNEKVRIICLCILISIIVFFLYVEKIEGFDTGSFIGKNINLKTNINGKIMYIYFSKVAEKVTERDKCLNYNIILDPNKKTKITIKESIKLSGKTSKSKNKEDNTYYIQSVDDNYYFSRRLISFNKVCGDTIGDTDEFTIEDSTSGKILIGVKSIVAGKSEKKYIGQSNGSLIFVSDKTKALEFECNII